MVQKNSTKIFTENPCFQQPKYNNTILSTERLTGHLKIPIEITVDIHLNK